MENDNIQKRGRAGKIFGGLIVVGIGIVYIMKQAGVIFPFWLFTWEMLLIVIGFYVGVRSGFRSVGWLIVMLIGGVFLFERIYPTTSISPYVWPAAIIVVGLFMIFTPHHSHGTQFHYRRKWRKYYNKEEWRKYKDQWKHGNVDPQPAAPGDDYIDIVSVFGGTHRVIVSKNFKGGSMVNIFGGSELNLSQADITGTVYIDSTQIFGGAKLIIPSNWELRSEVAAIFGGIEDKRPREKTIANPEKILVLTGASIFGGLEILSY